MPPPMRPARSGPSLNRAMGNARVLGGDPDGDDGTRPRCMTDRPAPAPTIGSDRMPATGRERENGVCDTRLGPGMRARERAYLLRERAGSPEGRESFPASGPPSHSGVTGKERRGR